MLLSCLIASVSLTYFAHHSLSPSLCALAQPPAASTLWLYLPNVGPALQRRSWRWSPFPFSPPSKRWRGNILQGRSAHGTTLTSRIYKQLIFAIFHLQDFSHALLCYLHTHPPFSSHSNNWHIINARLVLLGSKEVKDKPRHFWGHNVALWNSRYEEFFSCLHGADC